MIDMIAKAACVVMCGIIVVLVIEFVVMAGRLERERRGQQP